MNRGDNQKPPEQQDENQPEDPPGKMFEKPIPFASVRVFHRILFTGKPDEFESRGRPSGSSDQTVT
jgi:hypothetical protein